MSQAAWRQAGVKMENKSQCSQKLKLIIITNKPCNMKNKRLYIAAFVVCLCMFTATSKECGKIMNAKCTATMKPAEINPKTESTDQHDDKTDFSIINLLFFRTT